MIDIDAITARALGFPQVVLALAERCQTPRGKELALALGPLASEVEVRLALTRAEQARVLLRDGVTIPVGGADDVRGHVARAEKGGVLTPEELLACGRALSASNYVRAFLKSRREIMFE